MNLDVFLFTNILAQKHPGMWMNIQVLAWGMGWERVGDEVGVEYNKELSISINSEQKMFTCCTLSCSLNHEAKWTMLTLM